MVFFIEADIFSKYVRAWMIITIFLVNMNDYYVALT